MFTAFQRVAVSIRARNRHLISARSGGARLDAGETRLHHCFNIRQTEASESASYTFLRLPVSYIHQSTSQLCIVSLQFQQPTLNTIGADNTYGHPKVTVHSKRTYVLSTIKKLAILTPSLIEQLKFHNSSLHLH